MTILLDGRKPEVLLVEDNENDAILTRQGFKLAEVDVSLHHVTNGVECLAYLNREPPYESAPAPDLILLDLNMPAMNGEQVMEQIGTAAALQHLPVVVLTTSSAPQDILRLYRLRCNSYISKPVDYDAFVEMLQLLSQYWFSLVRLPVLE
jgi:CheY-like chemotaxis protein